MADYVYALGPRPAVEVDAGEWGWGWADGVMGLELVAPEQAPGPGVAGGVCLLWAGALPAGAQSLGRGDCRDMLADDAMRATWAALVGGGVPQGDRLIDLLWWQMTDGADLDGAAVRPLIPTAQGMVELRLQGHSLVRSTAWAAASAAHRDRVLASVQRDMRAILAASKRGEFRGARGPDAEGHRKALGWAARKYRDAEWSRLVPPEWPGKDAPVKPETAIADTFDRADSATLGTSSDATWSWNELSGTGWEINTNRARHSADSSSSFARADTDLSGVDHYCEMVFDNDSGAVSASGPCARKDSTATLTFYHARYSYSGGAGYQLYSASAGTLTQIGSNAGGTITGGDTVRLTCNGSTISVQKNGSDVISQTDTSIAGNTRVGMRAFDDIVAWRSMAASDIAAGATPKGWFGLALNGPMQRGVYP